MGYTLTQVHAFIEAIDRQESRRLASLLMVIATGSQGSDDTIKKTLKELSQ